MGELKNIRGGDLHIVNLRHEKYEFLKANLKEKQFNTIKLEWVNSKVGNDKAKATADEETLQDLQLHQNLKELKLYGYCGNKCSSWFESLTNVFSIELKNCTNLQYRPGLAYFPALKELRLENLPALVCISSDELMDRSSSSSSKATLFFPTLKVLTLKDMPSLKGWLINDVTISKSLVNLSSLNLIDLPKVEIFPDCISNLKSLKVLKIKDLENLNSSGLKGICSLPSLEILGLRSCNRLSTLPQDICHLSSSLKKLIISNCLHFHSLPEEIFHFTSLEILNLINLPELKSLSHKHLLNNIQQINFWNKIENKWKVKVFTLEITRPTVSTSKSEPEDYPTNHQHLKLHIREIPHLEEPVRNSGFSISFEGYRSLDRGAYDILS